MNFSCRLSHSGPENTNKRDRGRDGDALAWEKKMEKTRMACESGDITMCLGEKVARKGCELSLKV